MAQLRAPRLDVRVNGAPLAGVFAADVVSNNHLAADRFCVRAVADPATIGAIADTADQLVDVRISLDGAAAVSLVQGQADSIDIDAVAGTVRLDGRDLSAQLIEARTREAFANKTSSEIATTLAGRHGLSADVTATTTPVGRYWELEHDRVTLDQFSHARSEWDLLVQLAAHEGFDVWVIGTTLNFHPQAAPTLTAGATLRAVETAGGAPNVTTLRLERSLTLAREISVTVKSWNSRQQTAFAETAQVPVSAKRSAKQLAYVYVVPNLSAQDALQLAQRKLAEITSHERVAIAEMPGELTLAPRMLVSIEGTASGFDQVYVVDEIERSFDLRRGFTQRVRARTCSVS
ncbi:MAG TPA: hypothetical protein VHS58_18655 [Acetobacteraceae bacterium]|jgi:phage protein D|nr:hypothetical protein [Acetobacteraceae bacterium]